jgi:hypothetical protein
MQASTPQPRTALSHPLFWSALVGLLVNDHVLKPAHVLPGWVVGKLSDFVGMLVAPVVLTVLLRVRGGPGADGRIRGGGGRVRGHQAVAVVR